MSLQKHGKDASHGYVNHPDHGALSCHKIAKEGNQSGLQKLLSSIEDLFGALEYLLLYSLCENPSACPCDDVDENPNEPSRRRFLLKRWDTS
jgi:hypothetical protein